MNNKGKWAYSHNLNFGTLIFQFESVNMTIPLDFPIIFLWGQMLYNAIYQFLFWTHVNL